MALFGSSSPAAPAQTEAQAKMEEIKQQVRTQLQLASQQQLISTIGDKCFAKCVTKPGAMLTRSEETCVATCTDRYIEAFDIVSKSYATLLQKQASEAGAPGF